MAAAFLVVDFAFWGANLPKIPGGGWFPLVIAAIGFTLMTTWKHGREIIRQHLKKESIPLEDFLEDLGRHAEVEEEAVARVPGTAVYLYTNPEYTSPALLQNIKHNKVLHERVVILSVKVAEEPYVPEEERVEIEAMGRGIYRLVAHYGFAQSVDVQKLLAQQVDPDVLDIDLEDTTFFLESEEPLATNSSEISRWRDRLFGVMARNAHSATSFFNIPPERVMTMGAQVEL